MLKSLDWMTKKRMAQNGTQMLLQKFWQPSAWQSLGQRLIFVLPASYLRLSERGKISRDRRAPVRSLHAFKNFAWRNHAQPHRALRRESVERESPRPFATSRGLRAKRPTLPASPL